MLNVSSVFVTLVLKRLNDQYDLFNNDSIDVYYFPFVEDGKVTHSVHIKYDQYDIISYDAESKRFPVVFNKNGSHWPVTKDFDNPEAAAEYVISILVHVILEPEKIDEIIESNDKEIEKFLKQEGSEPC